MIVLQTERLIFRPHLPEDFEDACAMDMNPIFRAPFSALTREEAERSFREGWLPPKPLGLLATIYKADACYIGRCGLYRTQEGNPDEATLAFYLAPSYWNQGLATEAGRAFIKHGFETLNLKRIIAGAAVGNLASNRALQKSGMIRTHSGGNAPDGKPQWHAYEICRPKG